MLIRSEALADQFAIDRLLKKVFPTDAEAELVKSLRENGHNTLSLVACNDGGDVVGHLMFSPVLVDGTDTGVQGLAPLCVHPDYRGQGIAAQLVREGFDTLNEFGYPACVVLGDPAYYSRFGFKPAEEFGLSCKWDVPADAFMAFEFAEGAFNTVQGQVTYCAEFDAL
ncbi:N-acetyltransferase [Grimontia hollisae]|uniref:Acetyltransferase n=1 Tax=Grimontia hollisae CIP 101886 TaxID=675812 RepID=D0I7Y1_GRIHO|nr:N-acetyltransferase [Grimontia hollisae]AMG31117.1 N-acetyltransferase [Grimontia hollisae]EEY72750.1 acetyltransferase [Grimontia hollisae CIP 101886]MDF2185183.1 N-acetyltransferase [Grimontia hollisae]STO46575.1 Predicted acetyltransferase [Grimontia hollisae]